MTCNHQNFFRGIAIPLLGALIGLLPATVRAVIPVTGLSTNTTYSGSVTFSVAAEAGYVTTCSLDGSTINAAERTKVRRRLVITSAIPHWMARGHGHGPRGARSLPYES